MAFNPAKKKDKYQLHFSMLKFAFYAHILIAFFYNNGCCMQKRNIRVISISVISWTACTYSGKLAFRLSIDPPYSLFTPKNRGAAAPLNYKHTNYLVLTIFTLLYPDL